VPGFGVSVCGIVLVCADAATGSAMITANKDVLMKLFIVLSFF